MTTHHPVAAFDDQPVPLKIKLAAAWASLMFLYIYVDVLNFYTPGTVEDILDGKVFEFDLSQTFSVSALALMSVPSFMAFLSVTLPARPNRITQLAVGSVYVPVTVFNIVGGHWEVFYGLGIVLELVLLAYILRSAWIWPRR